MPEHRRRKQRKIRLSKLYSFGCGRSSFDPAEQSQLGGPGFSRVVHANESNPDDPSSFNFTSNSISTTKYNVFTFLPKSLFEQFRRVANMYFLVTACLSFTDLAPYSWSSSVGPLAVVILATMIKELIEDWRRKKQDNEVNGRKTLVLTADGKFERTQWRHLRVGDIVRVQKDEYFPADLVLLSSNFDDSICYVETMNLDGETNLKLKQSIEKTSFLQEEGDFVEFKARIRCEDPNADLYAFVGTVEIEEEGHPLSIQQLLLRDSKLRNTDYIYGVVVFTGHDTKVMQNSMSAPSKRSKIERKMDKIIYLLLALLVLISSVGSVFFGIWTKEDLKNGKMKRWYLRPDDTTAFYDPKQAGIAAVLHFLTAMMLYGYFIPISLYISIEIVKLLQAQFINGDIHMYHEESDTAAHARTSNLNEELGQVDTILSDKTGTLTCNSMEFIKCTVAGVAYGRGITEVEKAMARRKGSALIMEDRVNEENRNSTDGTKIKGFNFTDERIMGGNWIREESRDIIEKFFRLLAVCHTCIPEVDELSGRVSYEAESPDEAAFVVAAREIGFEFCQRTPTTVSLNELDHLSGTIKKRTYVLLNILEFNSARKRMSVIVRDENGKLFLFSKGADSVMFERLSKEKTDYEEITKEHINMYADAGLRTLVLAYREIDQTEYDYFNKQFTAAKNSVSADRDEKIEEAADMIERDLMLLGATAVEDKLQQGVPECIDKLAQAGIKIWVLTGDKMETAINIGYACSLLRQGMKQISITLDAPEIISVEKGGNKDAIAKESKRSVVKQINDGKRLINEFPNESFALIIDGKSLTYALEEYTKQIFFSLAVGCGSVICCRSSPKQKALVTRLVKTGTRKVTLAIGDGANDVGMLQEADIGIGISGAEGMQAVMASDVSIAQFRFLERLLLVHGHWCYRRISSMICYFFYKNVVFGMTMFIYEAYTSFSGQAAYNDWAMATYNVIFTSLPVIALGVLDQDVSARFCLKFPMLYQEGPRNDLFRWSRILSWMFNGIVTAVIIFFLVTFSFGPQPFRHDGQPADLAPLSAAMYTCCVWVVNSQMALSISYFTLIQHILIWGSVALWYLFLVIYGAITPSFSTTYYKVFVEELASAPTFWVVTLCISVAALVPYFAFKAVQTSFFPGLHDFIQWMRYEGRADDPEVGRVIRQASVRATVGVSARFDARINQLTGRVHHVVQTP